MSASPLANLLVTLPERHRAALAWFDEHAGQVVPWPRPIAGGTLLASKPKGIYKPEWSRYALSVRQSLAGPYPDKSPSAAADGSWTYEYFQEDLDPRKRDALFTNRGLINCWQDVVPVGVMIQVRPKPNPRYRVMGLALLVDWNQGFFQFHGITATAQDSVRRSAEGLAAMPQPRADFIASVFGPIQIDDERRRTRATIIARQGQPSFRQTLLDAYGHRCSVTGYDADDALEAAHIIPYRGPVTNHPTNGLLLRADVHSLFDEGLLAVDALEARLIVSRKIKRTAYWKFEGARLSLPEDEALQPSRAALQQHREWAGI